jgi:hypothetical protein
MQTAFPSIGVARSLDDETALDKLAQDAREALLRDVENEEQVSDPEAGIAGDEMQDAMMRATVAELGQDGVGVTREVAIGEEQQLDELYGLGRGVLGDVRRRSARRGRRCHARRGRAT